ncbi:G1/S-specific cyclin pas1 [Sphaceloma murrayae]|uniref:G1/S-specific cyclin pas1 n=1 Tax=Sphaceloma murrayae TaxID=2082308 RepID=A0A2K1QHG5_9PEZI|nr:G1/S-specific cyclin pas1 [Sphaceloma murrayae]
MDVCVFDPSHGGYVSVDTHKNHQDHVTVSRTPSPSTSIDDVFSVTSDNSSQSSHADSDEDSYQAFERKVTCADRHVPECEFTKPCIPVQAAQEQHHHPRRSISAAKRPPPLPRQDERKVLFVNDLVDSATNMVSVIWPLSGSPCTRDSNNKGVLPLRRYIEETLRRSRTSYSTLQVALYYLILVKDHIPCHDFTTAQPADSAALRAMQCGRRMFLAALILASKYLQDRNYSAKAWSKMSGLKTTEINSNERLFLSAVSWKLHIPDHIFKRWTDIVLRFTAPPSQTASGVAHDSKSLWARVIPLLTADLDDSRIVCLPTSAQEDVIMPTPASTPSPTPTLATFPSVVVSQTSLPSSAPFTPQFPEIRSELLPPTPGLVRSGVLPTPQMTPSSIAASTPAASTCSSRRPSISMAMAQSNLNMLCRITSDRLTGSAFPQRSIPNRFPSVAPSIGSCSSPESMISDLTRSSRSSSISSVSTSSSAPHRAVRGPASSRLGAILITNLDGMSSKKASFGTADHPIPILDVIDLTASPEAASYALRSQETTNLVNLVAPPNTRESRKRCRSRPTSTTDQELHNEVRNLLSQSSNAMDIDSDPKHAQERVHPCALRRAFANMRNACPLGAAKAAQPPAALRRGSSARIPIANSDGNKRVCSTTAATPEVYMAVNGDVWQGLP